MKQISLLLRIKPQNFRACGAAKPTQPWILSWIYLGWNYVLSQLTRDSQPVENQGVVTGNKEIEVWGNKLRFMLLFSLCPARVCPRAPAEKDITVDYLPAAGGNFLRMYTSIWRIWRSKSVWKWRKTTRESSKKRDFFPRRLTAPLRVQKTTDSG